ncbi:MAG: MoaD/ThiS family protein [Clostridiales bacterium]|nr:MoaD/ThiS family protein [Clostridiales bacterium]
MAKVSVKLFGVLRVDSKIPELEVQASCVADIFNELNKVISQRYAHRAARQAQEGGKPQKEEALPKTLSFKDAVVFINGERCTKSRKKLKDGDTVWLMSPASGG